MSARSAAEAASPHQTARGEARHGGREWPGRGRAQAESGAPGTLSCRFCRQYSLPPTAGGKPRWNELAAHVRKSHAGEAERIARHVGSRTEPASLSGRAPAWSGPTMGLEFRRRMGYGASEPGADESSSGD